MNHRSCGSALTRLVLLLAVVAANAGWIAYWNATAGGEMTAATQSFLELLDEEQTAAVLMEYDDERRLDWHFIPKDERKGLQIKHMNPEQRQAALSLLEQSLSEAGYQKATQIMAMEGVLKAMEAGRNGGPIRDTERYYFTVFGEPDAEGKWGLSIEGHHMSLNFVVDRNRVVSSTPTFFAANPATIMNATDTDFEVGTRVLEAEELLAFEFVNALTDEQRATAVIDETAPSEIRGAGDAQPPTDEAVGLAVSEMSGEQVSALRRLVEAYARNLPEEIAIQRMDDIRRNGPANIRFAWAGALEPGVGHYYRIQGPTFLIEFVNTQPDPAGNPANHIHCVWRDMRGDFAIAL